MSEIFEEAGLSSLSETDKVDLSKAFKEELQLRVGMELAGRVGEEQLAALSRLVDTGESERADAWLTEHCPDHQMIVQSELRLMRDVLKKNAPRILTALEGSSEGTHRT
jgi:hypothetical protein